ncbi:MAG TPA: hypothetical protein VK147_08805 [Candidatus Didemnitutus sp.]|nr:hypothetical protein [Candidatus Didemnitutus sp.]
MPKGLEKYEGMNARALEVTVFFGSARNKGRTQDRGYLIVDAKNAIQMKKNGINTIALALSKANDDTFQNTPHMYKINGEVIPHGNSKSPIAYIIAENYANSMSDEAVSHELVDGKYVFNYLENNIRLREASAEEQFPIFVPPLYRERVEEAA